MRHIRTLVPRLFEAHRLSEFHDIAEIGDSQHRGTQLYLDYCHLTTEGSKAVAERLFPVILRIVLDAVRHHDPEKNQPRVPLFRNS